MALFSPFILELIFALVIPSQTNLINQTEKKIQFKSARELNINDYGKHKIALYLNGTHSTATVNNLLNSFYTPENRPDTQLLQLSTNKIASFILEQRKLDVKNLVNNYYFGMSLNVTSDTKFYADLYFSTMAFHSSAIILNEITNLLLKFLTNDFNKTITTINAPISLNQTIIKGDDFISNLACIDVLPVSILNLINSEIVALIISLIAIHVTKERGNGFKSLQFISSTHFSTYWISNYIFDLSICLINIGTIVITIKLVDVLKNDPTNEINPIVIDNAIFYVLLLFFVSSLSWAPLAYIFSLIFKSDVVCFVILFIILSVAAFIDVN